MSTASQWILLILLSWCRRWPSCGATVGKKKNSHLQKRENKVRIILGEKKTLWLNSTTSHPTLGQALKSAQWDDQEQSMQKLIIWWMVLLSWRAGDTKVHILHEQYRWEEGTVSSKTQSIFHDVKAVRGSNTPKAESSVSYAGPLTAGVPVLGTSMYALFSYPTHVLWLESYQLLWGSCFKLK